MFAATSARKLELSSAASSGVSGGTSRVLTAPAMDALAMIATAHNRSDMTGSCRPLTRPLGAAEAIRIAEFARQCPVGEGHDHLQLERRRGSARAMRGEISLDSTHETAGELLLIGPLL